MIPCRAAGCRPRPKAWVQVREDPTLRRPAERRLSLQDGRVEKTVWAGQKAARPPGVYCAHCGTDLEYSPQDLTDYGIDDPPLLFVPPEDFSADEVLRAIRKKWGKRIAYVKEMGPQPERAADPSVATGLHPDLAAALRDHVLPAGRQLYLHQGDAVGAARRGEHVVVVTPTASGKSLCYQLPLLDAALAAGDSTAIYLSPLKALGADQFDSLCRFDPAQAARPATGEPTLENFYRELRIGTKRASVAVCDGSTPDGVRPKIKYELRPNVLITTPDWLSVAVLSRSEEWAWLFRRLRYVVVDEMHTYRGIFGSNFANLMRRLRRLCSVHGADPRFLFCSATVRNPGELARGLMGALPGDAVTVVGPDRDGSPKRRRMFVLMRGTEDALTTDARKLLAELVATHRASAIAFARSIPEVNRLYREAGRAVREGLGTRDDVLQPFMAPLPPAKKREIARRLSAGHLRGVVSTTALQLGIDIGNFSAGLLAGYPGSVAATWQQAGRAGRRGEGLYVLLADKDPVDQFWVDHPEAFFAEEPEEVVVDPDNRYVLMNQLWCAHRDLPIDEARDAAFFGRDFHGCLEELRAGGKVAKGLKNGRDVWVLTDPDGFPAKEIPLRNPLGKDSVRVLTAAGGEPVAYEDSYRATRRLHRFAVYQVIDDYYEVERLVLDGPERHALVRKLGPGEVTHFTTAYSQDSCEVVGCTLSRQACGAPLGHGEVTFGSEVVGYTRHYYEPVEGRERDYQPLGKARPPRRSFDTKATWVDLPAGATAGLGEEALQDALNSVGRAVVSAAAILRFADPNDLGALPETKGRVRLTVHEQYPGGIGLAERCYYRFEELLARARDILADCAYCRRHAGSKGCPRCAMDPGGRHDRLAAVRVLDALLGGPGAHAPAVRTPAQVAATLARQGYAGVELLDSGGMGAVYRGDRDGRAVALKVIEPRFWRENPEARELLLREGKVWQGLTHPHVLRLESVREADGVLFLEMEYAGEGTLRRFVGAGGEAAVALFKGVCDGVAYLHEKGLVHRDLKPDNVLFVRPGVPKVSDFGLAKAVAGRPATTLGGGTPGYWAPEQRRARGRVSPATDVYALGAILFELLSGRLPAEAEDGRAAEPDLAALPGPLAGVVRRCLQPAPADRYPAAGDLRRALDAV